MLGIVLNAVYAPPRLLQFMLCLQGRAVNLSDGVQCEPGGVHEPGLRISLLGQGFLPSQARQGWPSIPATSPAQSCSALGTTSSVHRRTGSSPRY